MNDDLKSIELINNTDSCHDTELEKVRVNVCSKIIQILDHKKLSTRNAEKLTGISHTEFSRIRNAKLQRFTLDRLIIILGKLDPQIEIGITFDTRHVVNTAPLNFCTLPSHSRNIQKKSDYENGRYTKTI